MGAGEREGGERGVRRTRYAELLLSLVISQEDSKWSQTCPTSDNPSSPHKPQPRKRSPPHPLSLPHVIGDLHSRPHPSRRHAYQIGEEGKRSGGHISELAWVCQVLSPSQL